MRGATPFDMVPPRFFYRHFIPSPWETTRLNSASPEVLLVFSKRLPLLWRARDVPASHARLRKARACITAS